MKNSNYKQHNNQERKFRKQVNHLSGFIGMQMWNGRNPSLSEIREYDRRVLEKQAQGFEPERKNLLKRLFDGLKTLALKTFRQVSKAGIKTKKLKHEITGPLKTGTECCG